MKICACSATTPGREWMTEPIFSRNKSYFEKNGIEWIDASGLVDTSRPAAWSKIKILRKLLDTYDFAIWIDDDAVVYDPQFNIRDYLKRIPLGFIAGGNCGMNSGVMGFRSHMLIKQMLDQIWTSEYKKRGPSNGDCWEQPSVIHQVKELNRRSKNSIGIAPWNIFNAIPKGLRELDGDGYLNNRTFIVHFAGIDKIRSREKISNWLQEQKIEAI